MNKIRTLFKTSCFLIVLLASGWQVYKLVWKNETIDGPLPIKEAKLLLQAAHELMASKQFDQASEKYQQVLKIQGKTPELGAEARLHLKVIRKRGGKVPPLPELAQEISIQELEGSQNFFNKFKAQDIKVTGKGVYPEGISLAQGKLMAERAAKVDAYRLILEEVKGISINSRVSLADVLVQDNINSRVSGKIQGAKIIGTRDLRNERIVEVDMVLSSENILASLR